MMGQLIPQSVEQLPGLGAAGIPIPQFARLTCEALASNDMPPLTPSIAPAPKQLGQRWTPPSAQELVRAVVVLQHSGQLLTLVQPVLTLSRAGRSKNFESASAEEVGRVKDFIDQLHAAGPSVAAMNYTLAGNMKHTPAHAHLLKDTYDLMSHPNRTHIWFPVRRV